MEPCEVFEMDAASPYALADKRCYSVEELMDILGLSRKVVYDLIKENRFRTVKISNRYRISKKSFDKWLDEQS